jgi:hypothetical protein
VLFLSSNFAFTNKHYITVVRFLCRVLRRIYGRKREEVVGGWRRLHNEELYELVRFIRYCYGYEIRDDEMGGTCSTDGNETCEQNVGCKI